MSDQVCEKFMQAIGEYSMLDGKKSVLVAFSGGADSTALLYLLHQLKTVKVYAAHVNHCIRGDEADRDESFCIDFCSRLGITLFHKKIDIPKLSEKTGCGTEETARKARYSYFDDLVNENGIDCIATAHNASDNTETVLLNLVRGTSLPGLCGIPPVRQNIIRPLIFCSKDMIADFCRNRGLDFVTDSTNNSSAYRRNYLRLNVIPDLRRINPSLDTALVSRCSSIRKDADYLDNLSSEYSFDNSRKDLAALPDPILSRVIIKELTKCGMKPEYSHVTSACNATRSQSVHTSLSVPGGTFICDRDSVYTDKDIPDNISPITLLPGVNSYGKDSAIVLEPPGFDFSDETNKLKNIYKLYISMQIDYDKITGDVVAGAKINSEKLRYGGIDHSVKKLLQSKKLTLRDIAALPVIRDESGVLIIPGFPLRDGIAPDDTTTSFCRISFFSNINNKLTKGT